jgi:hypothetical protein
MFRVTDGPARERLNAADARQLVESGTLFIDERRVRPLYFDGRFLTARDLTRDQEYVLGRLVDLGRATGPGVISGLEVRVEPSRLAVTIGPGHGLATTGEPVILDIERTVSLVDVAAAQRIDASFGLLQLPRDPSRSRTGLFILALRPVEFAANPIVAYPTSLDEQRSTADGDIIEGVAVTLIPYPDQGAGVEPGMRRARLAREIFLAGAPAGAAVGALPLAMLSLNGGQIEWADQDLVRREIGAEQEDLLGLGLPPRALREAHMRQYRAHLDDVLRERGSNAGPFVAASAFRVLPPAGPFPPEGINPTTLTQTFFPPAIDVELSFMPADEVLALLEESLLLSSIDLTASSEQLDSTAVLVLVAVHRQRFQSLRNTLSAPTRVLPAATPDLALRRRPLDRLRAIAPPRLTLPVIDANAAADQEWRRLLGEAQTMIYVRRRHLAYRTEIFGFSTLVSGNEGELEVQVNTRLNELGIAAPIDTAIPRMSALARAALVSNLSGKKLLESTLLMNGMVASLTTAWDGHETIDRATVLSVAERFGDPQSGEGLRRLEAQVPQLTKPKPALGIGQADIAIDLDRVARATPDAELSALGQKLLPLATAGKKDALRDLVDEQLERLGLK